MKGENVLPRLVQPGFLMNTLPVITEIDECDFVEKLQQMPLEGTVSLGVLRCECEGV